MAEFKDCGMWLKLTFLTIIIGFLLDMFGFAIGIGSNSGESVGLLIAGFLFFVLGSFLVLPLVFLDEARGNKLVILFFILFAFLAGLTTIIGIIIWGGYWEKWAGAVPLVSTYSTTVACCASLLALLSGMFGCLELCGVGGK